MHELKNPSVFPLGEPLPTDLSQCFIGQAYLHPLTDQGGPITNVTFEPNCRNSWHIHHHGGQILLVTGGCGWYQTWGEEPQMLYPGDVVQIPAEVKHWHGATKDSWFSHLAISLNDATCEWLEKVADEEYENL